MWKAYQHCQKATMSWVMSLDRQEWLVILAVVAVLGFFCMRGYGSRSNY